MQILQALKNFKENVNASIKLDKNNFLVSTPNALVLRSFDDSQREAKNFEQVIIAIKAGQEVIGNSSRLQTKERQDLLAIIQQPLSEVIPMIPFSVIKEAGLSLKDFKELDKGEEETVFLSVTQEMTKEKFESSNLKEPEIKHSYKSYKEIDMVTVKYLSPRHFTGARLFEIQGRVFLMDIDRVEIANGIFNPFLVELKAPAKTIKEAYAALKPQEVIEAEAQGLEVKRQGEWFFVPTNLSPLAASQEKPQIGYLRAGRSRPNSVEFFVVQDKLNFVSGVIKHTGREHQDLNLRSWHLAFPNTSTTSWQLSGDID